MRCCIRNLTKYMMAKYRNSKQTHGSLETWNVGVQGDQVSSNHCLLEVPTPKQLVYGLLKVRQEALIASIGPPVRNIVPVLL